MSFISFGACVSGSLMYIRLGCLKFVPQSIFVN